jgi:hypothetical protein
MNAIRTDQLETDATPCRSLSRAIARFEAWLRARGLEVEHDPFMPPAPDGDRVDAAGAQELVTEYLTERPGERPHWRGLIRHTLETPIVAVNWGDVGGQIALAG